MRQDLRKRLGKERLFFDGGTGSLLQAAGLKPGELPETWNLTRAEVIIDLHKQYLDSGCHIFNTNTFGANRLKYPDNLDAIVTASIRLAKEARRLANRENDAYIALDIGPTGKLLEPMGDLPFEEAVDIFADLVKIGVREEADLILIETMNDSYEAKAALLAAKENSDLPVLLTCVFDEGGKMLTGGTPESMVAMAEGLGVDGIGTNCSLGPAAMLSTVKRFVAAASVPVLVNPNAGLPESIDGQTVYNVDAHEFAKEMKDIVEETFLSTQMFFDNSLFYSYLNRLHAAGIDVPVLAGIMPITNKRILTRSLAMSGTAVPARYIAMVDAYGDSPEAMKQAGIAYATEQILDLYANGVRNVHVFAMNKPDVAKAISENIRPVLDYLNSK